MAFHGKLPIVPCNPEKDGTTFWNYDWLVSCCFEMLQMLQSQTRLSHDRRKLAFKSRATETRRPEGIDNSKSAATQKRGETMNEVVLLKNSTDIAQQVAPPCARGVLHDSKADLERGKAIIRSA
jgi:hypothetical protein